MLTIPKKHYIELVSILSDMWVRGIAFDIVFQNADDDEIVFANFLKWQKNTTIATTAILPMMSTETTCAEDMTCDGYPRPAYQGIPWWHIHISPLGDALYGTLPLSDRIWRGGNVTPDMTTVSPLGLSLYHIGTGDRSRLLSSGQHLIPYFWGSTRYQTISLSKILERPEAYRSTLSGAYVFVGESGTMIHDKVISPLSGEVISGVAVHAHFLDWLLQDKMLRYLDAELLWGGIVFLTVFSILLYYTLPKYFSPFVLIILLCAILWISRYLYDVGRVLVDIFLLFLAGGIVTYPMTFIYRFFIVDREKRELQNNFGHYIDPHVVEEIANRGEEIQLGGEDRVLSVLFSDIAGFTTISESMKPEELFYLMTSYLSNMTDILIAHGGTLDKYIGDAVMGFFGAPLSYEDHARRAADTALDMRARLPGFNEELVRHGIKPIDFRVGIATGSVMVGNIGSHDRFNYTVLGDTVNLASRLEWTGKEYDVHIIIPESTRSALWPLYLTRELDTIAVKWKTQWVKIYELIGMSVDYPDRTLYLTYEKALALYRQGDYRAAGKLWQTIAPTDPPSRIMMYRCLEILQGKIVVEDGIYRMTHK